MSQSGNDIADWNRIAATYARHDGYEEPLDNPMYRQLRDELWESLGELGGKQVLDLGCGDGWLSLLMRDAGAHVTGVDGSDALLAIARRRAPHLRFLQADLSKGLPTLDEQYDRVVSTMVLMDLPDLSELVRDIRRCLKADGRLIFTILHPCFYQYKIRHDEERDEWFRRVTNYQDEQVWRIDSFGGHNHYHRNLTYYADLLRANDLAITRFFEPEWNPDPSNAHAHVVRRWPICLLIEAQPHKIG